MGKIIALLCFILLSGTPFAKSAYFESGDYQNTLVELYTSEGCSSCPPADQWLSTLQQHPKLFNEIIPVAFHVDYWDYIGWKDRFANSQYSNQQKKHYQERNISQIHTPQVIKNGKEDRAWRYQRKVDLAGNKVGKLVVDIIDDVAYIHFKSQQRHTPLTAHIALLGSGFESRITAGENDNKTLKHDFVVLDYKKKNSKVRRWSIPLPNSEKLAKRFAVAVWVTHQNSLKPIQVTGSWF